MVPLKRIRTSLSAPETRTLREFSRGRMVVECGALLGYSTRILALEAGHVISVDKHTGYGPSTLAPYMRNVEGVSNITPVIGDALTVLPKLGGERYFFDLTGKHDLTLAVLNLVPDHCPVALHDFGRINCDGVELAVKDAGFKVVTVVDTLALVQRR